LKLRAPTDPPPNNQDDDQAVLRAKNEALVLANKQLLFINEDLSRQLGLLRGRLDELLKVRAARRGVALGLQTLLRRANGGVCRNVKRRTFIIEQMP